MRQLGDKPLIGVVHLLPLPGSPRGAGSDLRPILERAVEDATALAEGGADAAIVENLGDAPYVPLVPPETTAAMALIVGALRREVELPLGVNLLRNDGAAAMAIAALTGAAFIRINVLCGAAVTDAGWVEGAARRLLELRRRLAAEVRILADVHVKHAAHFNGLEEATLDASRNGADALIVSGPATGHPPTLDALRCAQAHTDLPVYVGSGMTAETVADFAAADGFIVGSTLHRDNDTDLPVERSRVRRVADAVKSIRGG
jgi:hypothetical protein